VQRWTIRQFGKYKVAILGWITPDTVFTAANVGNVTFSDPLSSVKKCISEIKSAHPDVHMIIGLSHTGGF
jgi:2',3'-cyclic-nucleotide 2'-phosphodiesterase (5'-nucleotidase family)